MYQDLVRSAPAAAAPLMMILWESLWGPGMKILLKVLYNFLARRSCGNPSEILPGALAWSCTGPCKKPFKRCPGEILSVSLHDLVQVLVRRSCGDPVEILLKRSLHQDLEDPLRWCLYESSSGTLIGSSCLKVLCAPLYRSIYKVLLLELRSCLTSSVTVPQLLLLVSGTLTP